MVNLCLIHELPIYIGKSESLILSVYVRNVNRWKHINVNTSYVCYTEIKKSVSRQASDTLKKYC